MTLPRISSTTILAVLLVMLGCSEENGKQQAEIWIVANPPVYELSDHAPSFAIHRPTAGVLTEDGTAIIGNYDHLVFLRRDGSPVASAGRAGSGPGEFNRIHKLFYASGVVWAYDTPSRSALRSFTLAGEYSSELTLPAYPIGEAVGVLEDGNIVLWDHAAKPVERLVVVDTSGRVSGSFGSWVPAWQLNYNVKYGGRDFRVLHQIGCSSRNLSAVVGAMIFVAEQSTRTVYALGADKEPRPILSRPVEAITEGHNTGLGRVGDPFPYSWDQILPDRTGRIWLRRVKCDRVPGVGVWDIVDTTGRHHLELRTDLHVLAAYGDRILALGTDSLTISVQRIVPESAQRRQE